MGNLRVTNLQNYHLMNDGASTGLTAESINKNKLQILVH
jgi:hypothetical protein